MLEKDARFPVGRQLDGLVAGFARIAQGFLPQFGVQGVMGKAFRKVVAILVFDRPHDAVMQLLTPSRQQTAIRHLMGQRMFEPEQGGRVWYLIKEFGGLQIRQKSSQFPLPDVRNLCQQRNLNFVTNDGCGLQQPSLRRTEPIDAARQNCLHAVGDLDGTELFGELVSTHAPP